jgi:hypothetical protein
MPIKHSPNTVAGESANVHGELFSKKKERK